MKRHINPLFTLYQFTIALPVLLVLTILTALLTILLSPAFPNNQLSYYPARCWGKLFCKLLFIKVEISGTEKLDEKKSYVIACNHQSIYDIFVIYGWLPMIFKWIMKAELRRISWESVRSSRTCFYRSFKPCSSKTQYRKSRIATFKRCICRNFP